MRRAALTCSAVLAVVVSLSLCSLLAFSPSSAWATGTADPSTSAPAPTETLSLPAETVTVTVPGEPTETATVVQAPTETATVVVTTSAAPEATPCGSASDPCVTRVERTPEDDDFRLAMGTAGGLCVAFLALLAVVSLRRRS